MTRISSGTSRIAALLAALLLAAPVLAQSTATGRDFDERTLRSYAAAAVEVNDIISSAQTDIRGAVDEAELTKLRRAAEAEMAQAVEDEGLSVEQYNAISRAAREDPKLKERLRTYIAEAQTR